MSILSWDKPEKAMSVESWQSITADSAPPGVYTPNMSEADKMKWKARFVGFKAGHPQVEIRRAAMVLVVSLGDGYKYKYYTPDRTRGVNVHFATAGPALFTFDEFEQMNQAVQEAKSYLEDWERTNPK